jgi:hypothetical protein
MTVGRQLLDLLPNAYTAQRTVVVEADLARRGLRRMDQNRRSVPRCPRCDTMIAESDVWIAESGVVVLCGHCGFVGEPADNMSDVQGIPDL